MDLFQVIILAIVQGLSEFLPISSSAHLILPSKILGWPDQGLAFDVAVHVGSLAAVVIYFRRDLQELIAAFFASLVHRQHSQQSHLCWYIVLGTIPAGLCGLLLGDLIENHLRTVLVIAATTIVFGVLLGLADRKASENRDISQLNWRSVLFIGAAQALALIPGTSRSGITMTAALALGFNRVTAARFSFLLSIPVILLSGGLKTLELIGQTNTPWLEIGIGALLSGITAYICIALFLRWIEKVGMMPFVWYRLALGVVLLYIALG
ncbi:undecaprenyl-diphosphate phosphatase [Porticoccus sp. W117]|uniref:undecaprenyl-diphosphate phosphatase n=1 Tax=Porticoccus sp. W117 TaxID=3054777 RepID=UPI0025940276|nr:undecaprenyl-diphosphate phosphatase [Porticoccus sp. W117]MDM3869815.1 undecaprenyl-diphosphate phosphatase [Porticoccus sp. W117]